MFEFVAKDVSDALEKEKAAREKLEKAVSVFSLIQDVFSAARTAKGIPQTDAAFEQRAADDAERDLLNAFLAGELECLGRKRADTPLYDVLPRDYFRLPIVIRVNHNILEPSGKGTVEDHAIIMEHVSKWTDLRVSVAALKMWRDGSKADKQSTTHSTRGRKRKWDWDGMFAEVVRLAHYHPDGLPETQADVERHVAEWFILRTGNQPTESDIRAKIALVYKAIREGRKLSKR